MAALDRFYCRCLFHVAVPDSVPDEMGALEHFTREFRDRLVTDEQNIKTISDTYGPRREKPW